MKRHTLLPRPAMRLAALAALLIGATCFTACEDDESDLGIDLVDPTTLFDPHTHTLYPNAAWSQLEDSLRTSNDYNYVIIGNTNDPIFGRTSAVLFAQVTLPESATTMDFSGVEPDSVVLTLTKHRLYPDTAGTYRLRFEVKQLAEAIESNRHYYSTDELPVDDATLFYDATVEVGYADSVVRLVLDRSILPLLTRSDSADAFAAAAKGLRIRVAEGSDDAMMSIDFSSTATNITYYYHYTASDGEVRSGEYTYPMGIGTAFFSHFIHDYTGTVFASGQPVAGTDRLYLQPLGGYVMHLNFDADLRAFHEAHPLAAIHHAELRLPLTNDNGDQLPDQIITLAKQGPDSTLILVDDIIDMYTYAGYDGTYHPDLGYYRIRLTQHLQGLLRQGHDDGMTLLIDSRRHTASSAIVHGTADTATSPKIVLVYTE